jgi:hypothetical protein
MKKLFVLAISLLILTVTLAACEGGEQILDPATLTGSLDALDSYRQEMQITFSPSSASETAPAAAEQRLRTTLRVSTDPQLQEVQFVVTSRQGDSEVEESFRFVQDPNAVYLELPGYGCVITTPDQLVALGAPVQGLPSLDGLLGLVERARLEASDQPINGRTADYYAFDQADLQDVTGVEALDGRIFVDTEASVPLRLSMEGSGAVDFLTQEVSASGDFMVQLDILDVNEPMFVDVPVNCDPIVPGPVAP